MIGWFSLRHFRKLQVHWPDAGRPLSLSRYASKELPPAVVDDLDIGKD